MVFAAAVTAATTDRVQDQDIDTDVYGNCLF